MFAGIQSARLRQEEEAKRHAPMHRGYDDFATSE